MEKMKIILLGESGVGKTAFFHRFKTGKFDETSLQTIQVHAKIIQVDGEEIKVILWDYVGQESYKLLGTSYFINIGGVLLLYDVTNINSFLALSNWVRTMKKNNKDAPILIVGNKNEEESRGKQVNFNVAQNFASEGNFDNIEISVKTGDKVDEALLCLIRKVLMAKRAATAKKVKEKGFFSYLTVKEKNRDVIKLTKDGKIQNERRSDSWCSC